MPGSVPDAVNQDVDFRNLVASDVQEGARGCVHMCVRDLTCCCSKIPEQARVLLTPSLKIRSLMLVGKAWLLGVRPLGTAGKQRELGACAQRTPFLFILAHQPMERQDPHSG